MSKNRLHWSIKTDMISEISFIKYKLIETKGLLGKLFKNQKINFNEFNRIYILQDRNIISKLKMFK